MSKQIALFFVLFLCANFIQAQTLPTKIKSYLNKSYKGWKLSPSIEGCGLETNNGVVKGNFNSDKKLDYAVKITKGKKGYIIAFLAQNQGYKAFVLHNTDAEEVNYSSLGTWKKSKVFEDDGKSFRLKYDAPSDYHCESDVGGIHYFQNGKFVGY
jgi:hypothetical protein